MTVTVICRRVCRAMDGYMEQVVVHRSRILHLRQTSSSERPLASTIPLLNRFTRINTMACGTFLVPPGIGAQQPQPQQQPQLPHLFLRPTFTPPPDATFRVFRCPFRTRYLLRWTPLWTPWRRRTSLYQVSIPPLALCRHRSRREGLTWRSSRRRFVIDRLLPWVQRPSTETLSSPTINRLCLTAYQEEQVTPSRSRLR